MEKCKKTFLAFLRWPGWTAWLKWKGWKRIAHWSGWTAWLKWHGWKSLLFPHPAIVAVLTPASAAALIWVFLTGRENSYLAYLTYCAAFYALVILTALIGKAIPKSRQLIHIHPVVEKVATNKTLRFELKLYMEQTVNFLYGIFKLMAGAVYASTWIGADGLYNLIQGIIQLYQILRRKKATSLKGQWKSYRMCGWLTIGMHLAITGLVFQMIHRNAHAEYPGYMIFATAAFTFFKLINAFWKVVRDRRHERPVDSAVRLLDLSQALYNLFALQAAMLWEFGGTDREFALLMNSLTGGAVCLLVICMGIYMLRRSRRELRKWEEENG